MQIPLFGHKSQTANISILAVSFRAPSCAYFQSEAGPFLVLYPLLKLNIRFSKDEILSLPMTPIPAGQADAGTQCQELQDSCFARRDSPPPDSLHQSWSLGFQKIKYISLFSPLNVRPYVPCLFWSIKGWGFTWTYWKFLSYGEKFLKILVLISLLHFIF